jgi:hypothetical protein
MQQSLPVDAADGVASINSHAFNWRAGRTSTQAKASITLLMIRCCCCHPNAPSQQLHLVFTAAAAAAAAIVFTSLRLFFPERLNPMRLASSPKYLLLLLLLLLLQARACVSFSRSVCAPTRLTSSPWASSCCCCCCCCCLHRPQPAHVFADRLHLLSLAAAAGTGLRLFFTERLRPNEIGILTLGQFLLDIPPGQSEVKADTTFCPTQCSSRCAAVTLTF